MPDAAGWVSRQLRLPEFDRSSHDRDSERHAPVLEDLEVFFRWC